MLSIIISSYQHQYYNQLKENIHQTIGEDFPYEIVQIWNPNLMSITEAYNEGAEKSQYNHLLFLHEDLIFHTENWGKILINHLSDNKTGFIGIAGSSYVPSAPCSWTVSEKHNFIHLLQGNKNDNTYVKNFHSLKNRNSVFALDGVFLAVKKENYNQIKFDSDIKGFHGYDLDISLRASKKFQNYVVDDILIQHFSKGNQDKTWFDTNVQIREKLNFKFDQLSEPETEKQAFGGFLYQYFNFYSINFSNILYTLRFYPLKHLRFAQHLFFLKKYLQLLRYSKEINNKHT